MIPPKSDAGAGPRRFYDEARAVAQEGAALWAVQLDGRPLRTPAKAGFVAPQAVATAAAEEWAAQGARIDPRTMPITRAVNVAIDRVGAARADVAASVAAYADSDLICYRADGPQGLIARQAAAWDPVLDWAAQTLDAPLVRITGVMHQPQPEEARSALARAVSAESDLGLVALSELTTLSGSLAIALAVARQRLEAEAAWAISRIDEVWQAEQWGRDAEAEAAAEIKRQDFLAAARLRRLLSSAEDA